MSRTVNRVLFCLTSLLLGLGLCSLSTVLAAGPGPGPPLQPSPRPTITPATGEEGPSRPVGAIVGHVRDLSTGLPGAGLEIQINGAIVRADGAGNYSLTGLDGGDFTVQLVLPDAYSPAQDPVLVRLAGHETAVVDLSFYSLSLPEIAADLAPPALPHTGAATRIGWPLRLISFGFGLAAGGWVLRRRGAGRDQRLLPSK